MKFFSTLTIVFFLTTNLFAQVAGVDVFINEIHYDNVGADANEGVEVAGPAGTNLNTFVLTAYTGATGAAYDTQALTGVIPDEGSGYGTIFFPIAGLQNGSPDGIALSDASANVQFISYEGSFVATDGAAMGMTSTDIGISQNGAPIGETLQLIGTGFIYSDFVWTTQSPASYDLVNVNQSFGLTCDTFASITEEHCETYTSPSGNYTWTISNTYMDTIPNMAACDSIITISLTINPLPTVIAGTDQIVCEGDAVTLIGAGADTYLWDNGVDDNVAFTPSVGSITYEVTGTDLNGCQNTDQVSVTVNPLPTVGAGTDLSVCDGTAVTLMGSGADTYVWDNGVDDNVAFTPAVGSVTYEVTGTDLNGCENTDQVDVTVNALPTVTYSEPVTMLCIYDSPITLSGETPSGGVFSGAGVSGSSFDPSAVTAGSQTITYTYTDVNSCINTATSDIMVDECLSITPVNQSLFSIYPNPTQGTITIEFEGKNAQLLITDLAGKEILSTEILNGKQLNLESYSAGQYIVSIQIDGQTFRDRIIVK